MSLVRVMTTLKILMWGHLKTYATVIVTRIQDKSLTGQNPNLEYPHNPNNVGYEFYWYYYTKLSRNLNCPRLPGNISDHAKLNEKFLFLEIENIT